MFCIAQVTQVEAALTGGIGRLFITEGTGITGVYGRRARRKMNYTQSGAALLGPAGRVVATTTLGAGDRVSLMTTVGSSVTAMGSSVTTMGRSVPTVGRSIPTMGLIVTGALGRCGLSTVGAAPAIGVRGLSTMGCGIAACMHRVSASYGAAGMSTAPMVRRAGRMTV